jgi:uncharacterized protein involved in outer membrane biogenesis
MVAHTAPSPIKQMGSRRKLSTAIIVLVVLAAATIAPANMNLNRHKARLVQTLRAELGRDVVMGDVHPRLLPTPGFQIQGGLSIADDPAFSAEPLLHADEVSADLRLASLWRGRIEIAKISFKNPSLNLVRNAEGHWNLESLMQRAQQIPSAPTSARRAEARPRFPYIEADEGRINFKQGLEKSVYALLEADFSFWLESDDHWNARLLAKPVRTDMPIFDTGTVKLSARLGRANELGAMPLEGNISVAQAQLGQLSKLIFGRDEGWRGALDADLSARGRVDQLQLASKLQVSQFRRFDVAAGDAIELAGVCSGVLNYAGERRSLDALACSAPIGDGKLGAHGFVARQGSSSEYSITVQAHTLPTDQLARIYRNIHQNVASDLRAQGRVEGNFTFAHSVAAGDEVHGSGSIQGLRVQSSRLVKPIEIAESIALTSGKGNQLELEPFQAPGIGALTGNLALRSYELKLRTDADVPLLLSLGRTFGLSVPFSAKQGRVIGTIALAGKWSGFQPPQLTGNAALSDVVAGNGARELHIASARLALSPQSAQLDDLHASIPAVGLAATGDISVRRPCAEALDCPFSADLRITQLDTSKLAPLFSSNSGVIANLFNRGSWIEQNQDALSRLNIVGTIRVDHLRGWHLPADNVNASFRLADSKLSVSNLTASVAGGRLLAPDAIISSAGSVVTADFTLKADHASIVDLLALSTHSNISGAINGEIKVHSEGSKFSEMLQSASGKGKFEVLNGAFSGSDSSFQFRRLSGAANLANQQVTLEDASATASAGKPWQATGSFKFDRNMDVQFLRGDDTFTIKGPLVGTNEKRASK